MKLLARLKVGIAVSASAIGALAAAPAHAAPILQFAGNVLLGATGVTVGALGEFSVEFKDGSCVGLFSGCDAPADFTFSNEADATAAATALLNDVLVGSSVQFPGQTLMGCDFAQFSVQPRHRSPSDSTQAATLLSESLGRLSLGRRSCCRSRCRSLVPVRTPVSANSTPGRCGHGRRAPRSPNPAPWLCWVWPVPPWAGPNVAAVPARPRAPRSKPARPAWPQRCRRNTGARRKAAPSGAAFRL